MKGPLKPRDKVTQKMTRDGAIEVNETQQTAQRISQREQDADFQKTPEQQANKVHFVEKDNSGVEGAHKSEETAEKALKYGARKVREGYHSHKLKPYRAAAKAERAAEKANVNYLYQKALQDNPQIAASNPAFPHGRTPTGATSSGAKRVSKSLRRPPIKSGGKWRR